MSADAGGHCGVLALAKRLAWEPKALEGAGRAGETPVGEPDGRGARQTRVLRARRKPVGSWDIHVPRQRYLCRPIADEYREGRVKRTPGGE